MARKIILFLISFVFILSNSVNAGTLYNYPYLYKGVRSLGMGGTFTAVGKDPEALFYNPAGLYEMGFQLAIINPAVEVDQTVINLGTDAMNTMKQTSTTDRMSGISDIIGKNMGKPVHGRASLFPHIAARNIVVGAVGQGSLDARFHNPLSSQGAIEVSGGYEYGPVGGFSFGIPTMGLRIGAGAKYISNSWLEKGYTLSEIASGEIDPTKDLINKADYSFDVGLLYDLSYLKILKPKLGLSFMDITDLDFRKNNMGRMIPMRGNIGLSINPTIPLIADTVIAIDYQDFTGAYTQDKSMGKRLHMGAEIGLLKRFLMLRGGFNQGYPSLGAELDLWILRLGYAYYTEEMGAYSGQDKDTRHLIQLSLGW